jgi:exodeoxyribonuclease V alpha subunit
VRPAFRSHVPAQQQEPAARPNDAAAAAPRRAGFGRFAGQVQLLDGEADDAPAGMGDDVGFSSAPGRAPARSEPVDTRRITGTIVQIRMFNADWGTASLVTDDYEVVKLEGEAVKTLEEQRDYEITGTAKSHPKYGLSYVVVSHTPSIKLNEDAIVKFIADNFEKIGKKTARKFVDAVVQQGGKPALEAVRQTLLRAPWDLDFSIIKKEGAFQMSSDDKDKSVLAFITRELTTRISDVPPRVLGELAEWLLVEAKKRPETGKNPVERAWDLLSEDPYTATRFVSGYGFATADRIGRDMKIDPEAPVRLRALACFAIGEACEGAGNVYVHMAEAVTSIKKFDPRVRADQALAYALESELLGLAEHEGHQRIYPLALLKAEQSLAKSIARLVAPQEGRAPKTLMKVMVNQMSRSRDKAKEVPHRGDLPAFIQKKAKGLGGAFANGLDPSQVEALRKILTSESRLHTLTAGPGCGKTAVMEVLLTLLNGCDAALCAPTGKAAKVLTSRVAALGREAVTINSLLGGAVETGFAVNEKDQLSGDLLVIDEGSMPDLRLMDALLKAVPPGMHVLVLGDDGQLPSIAPGCVLSDLLQIPQVDHNELTKTHRNTGAILDVVKQIRQGGIVTQSRDDVWFSGTLPSADRGFHQVMSRYIESVEEVGLKRAILLMSRRQGKIDEPGWNTTYANEQLRRALNRDGQRIAGCAYLTGDRIIIRKNMVLDDEGASKVVNGDTGTIISGVHKQDKGGTSQLTHLTIKLDDDRQIEFPAAGIISLGLAYALTVHAAQGSEYSHVVSVLTKGSPSFVNRNMAYTLVSRARDNLVIFGNDADLKSIAATPQPKRNSGLVERVAAAIEELQDADVEDDAADVPDETEVPRERGHFDGAF